MLVKLTSAPTAKITGSYCVPRPAATLLFLRENCDPVRAAKASDAADRQPGLLRVSGAGVDMTDGTAGPRRRRARLLTCGPHDAPARFTFTQAAIGDDA